MNTTESRIREALHQLDFLSDVAVVGGAVRDALVGRESDDIDVATSDRPQVVKEKAEARGWKTVDTGIEHGTVTLLDGNTEFEVTTFRRDVSCDGRNATVEFADSIREDLSRRDFTINAMAARLDGDDLEIIDPFGGQRDINKELISTVGHALTRFKEDYLRVVRALRFAARYDFDIAQDARRSMIDLSGRVTENVSVERIVTEIEKAMKDDRPDEFLRQLIWLDILQDAASLNKEVSTIAAMKAFDEEAVQKAASKDRMTVFLLELSSTCLKDLGELQKELRLPNDLVQTAEKVGIVLELLKTPVGEKNRREILAAYRDVLPLARRIGVSAYEIPEQRLEDPNVSLEPVLSGQDLIEAGMEEGRQIGEKLDEAHRIQVREETEDKAELLSRVL